MSNNSIIPIFTIDTLKFRFNGNEENTRNGIVKIINHSLFEPDGNPTKNGLYDSRMGTIEHNNICPICLNGKKKCLGHRGRYELDAHVIQPLAIFHIKKLLKIFCFNCGNIMVNFDKLMELPINKRFTAALNTVTEGKACSVCKEIHPKIVRTADDNFTIYAENNFEYVNNKKGKSTNVKTGTKLYAGVIQNIFSKISPDIIKKLNLSDPMKLIFNVLEIAPNCIRPSSKSFINGASNYHDITTIYQHIIKRNNEQTNRQLPEATLKYIPNAVVPPEIDIKLQNTQQFVYDLILGSSPTSQNATTGKRSLMIGSRPVNSIMRGLKSKEGIIRQNLLGKRVINISRSTISGDSKFKIDEVGIPLEYAKILYVKETVQSYNREFLMSILFNGKKQYPGCSHIIKKSTGEMHDVSGLKGDYYLEIGDDVFRNIINGDIVWYNRQPSLGYSSIGAHIVKVMNIRTFVMNVIACSWYGADFDGDQMNLWVPHEPGSIIEAELMSHVSNAFISIQTGSPVSGQVQDSMLGCYQLTRNSVRMDKIHAMRLFTNAGLNTPNFSIYESDHIFSGLDIVSMLLKINNITINYSGVPNTYDDNFIKYIPFDKNEKYTVIKDGEMITGVLDKKSIGEKINGGLFHIIGREYGSKIALDMIYYFQQISLMFLYNSNFTISLSDLYLGKKAMAEIHKLCDEVQLESNLISDKLIRGDIIAPINSTINEFYEEMQLGILKINDSEVLRVILQNINTDTNGLYKMISVGSRGKINNLIHIVASIGQSTLNGERIKEGFSHGRTLPYFKRFSLDMAASGYINNSYISGLKVSEFTFGAMTGRFDLISKALSTASTGYMARKGVLANTSSITNNHLHVVKDSKIVQFIYGEDGLDGRELEIVKLFTMELDNDELLKITMPENLTKNNQLYDKVMSYIDQIKQDRIELINNAIKYENTIFNSKFSSNYLLPVNVNRQIKNMIGESTLNNLDEKIEKIIYLCNNLAYVFLNEIQETNQRYIPMHKKYAAKLMCISIRAELNPNILSRLTNDQINYIITFIRHKYSISLIGYGVAVGILAAQSVSEPMTQYMLDSHHRSVSGGTNKSGLVRVNEIYGAKGVSKEQSATMQLLIRPNYAKDIVSAQLIGNVIEYVCFKHLIKRYDIILESETDLKYPPYKKDISWMNECIESHLNITKPNDLTKWCYRIIINKTALILKAISLELIIRQLKIKYQQGIYILYTSESVEEITIRIWATSQQLGKSYDFETKAINFLNVLIECPIRGVKGIMRATAKQITKHKLSKDGKLIQEKRFVIETIGTNLSEVFLYAAIDPLNSITSSIGNTNEVFGIEAARSKIISETISFMQKDAPNLRHLSIYADELTRTGKYTNLEKSGVSLREPTNVLLKASFSSPIQVFQDAAINETTSKVNAISGKMLLGATPAIGTFYNSLAVDTEFIAKNTKSIDSILDNL